MISTINSQTNPAVST